MAAQDPEALQTWYVKTFGAKKGRRGSVLTAALPGGDIPDANFSLFLQELRLRRPWLPLEVAHGYARRYGTRVDSLLHGAKSISDLGRPFGGTLYEREARFLAREEWAIDAEIDSLLKEG